MGLHLLPSWYPVKAESHLAEAEGVHDPMDELHLRKIDLADEVFVVNFQDYIGDSTGREVEYTMALGKPIRWFSHDPVGKKLQTTIDEFLAGTHEGGRDGQGKRE